MSIFLDEGLILSSFEAYYEPDSTQSAIDPLLREVPQPPLLFLVSFGTDLYRTRVNTEHFIWSIIREGMPDVPPEAQNIAVTEANIEIFRTNLTNYIRDRISNVMIWEEFVQVGEEFARSRHVVLPNTVEEMQEFVGKILYLKSITAAYCEYDFDQWCKNVNTITAFLKCVYFVSRYNAVAGIRFDMHIPFMLTPGGSAPRAAGPGDRLPAEAVSQICEFITPSHLPEITRFARERPKTEILAIYRMFINRLYNTKHTDFIRTTGRVLVNGNQVKRALGVMSRQLRPALLAGEIEASMERTPLFRMQAISSAVGASLPKTLGFGRSSVRSKSSFVRDYMNLYGVPREYAEHKYDRAVSRLKR